MSFKTTNVPNRVIASGETGAELNRPKIAWETAREFEEAGIVVQISASDGRRTRYSVRVGKRGENGIIPFLPLFLEGQGEVRVVSVVNTIASLLTKAEAYVQERAQDEEDLFIQQKIDREQRGVERDGKKKRR